MTTDISKKPTAPVATPAPGALVDSFRFSRGERTAALVCMPLFALMTGAGLYFWLKPTSPRDVRLGLFVAIAGAGFFVFFVARWFMFRATRFDLFENGFRWQHGSRVVAAMYEQVAAFDWRVATAYVRGVPAPQNHIWLKLRDGREIRLDESIERAAQLGKSLEGLLAKRGVVNRSAAAVKR